MLGSNRIVGFPRERMTQQMIHMLQIFSVLFVFFLQWFDQGGPQLRIA